MGYKSLFYGITLLHLQRSKHDNKMPKIVSLTISIYKVPLLRRKHTTCELVKIASTRLSRRQQTGKNMAQTHTVFLLQFITSPCLLSRGQRGLDYANSGPNICRGSNASRILSWLERSASTFVEHLSGAHVARWQWCAGRCHRSCCCWLEPKNLQTQHTDYAVYNITINNWLNTRLLCGLIAD